MNAIDTNYANSVDFYMCFGIGISLSIAVIGFCYVGWSLRQSRKRGLRKPGIAEGDEQTSGWQRLLHPPAGRGDVPLWVGIAIFLFSTTTYVVLCHYLVPGFPLWILLGYGFVYTPVISYVAARMEGIAGQWVEIPMLREATFIAASTMGGYRGVGIWFAPIPINNHAMTAVDFRTQELTGTKFTSLIKAELIIFPVVIVSSILLRNISGNSRRSHPHNTPTPTECSKRTLAGRRLCSRPRWGRGTAPSSIRPSTGA